MRDVLSYAGSRLTPLLDECEDRGPLRHPRRQDPAVLRVP